MISIDKLKKLHIFLSLFLLLWANNGIFSYINLHIPSFIKFLVFGICIIIETIIDKNNFKKLINRTLPLIIMFLIVIITYIIYKNTYLMIIYKALIYIFIIYSQYLYYINEDNKTKMIIINILLIDYLFLSINTLINLIDNPYLSRMLSTADAEYVFNVGSFSFIYSTILFIIYFINNIVENKNRLFSIIFVIFLMYLLFMGNFTISYLILLCSIIVYIILKLHNKKKFISITLIIILILISFNYIIPKILNYVYNNLNFSYEVRMRVKEMSKLWSGDNIDGTDIDSRLYKYKSSLNSFADNIFFGTFDFNKIGEHSSWLDLLGMFGLTSILFFFFQHNIFKEIYNNISTRYRPVLLTIIFVYFLQGLINTVLFFNTFLYMFFVIPLLFDIKSAEIVNE